RSGSVDPALARELFGGLAETVSDRRSVSIRPLLARPHLAPVAHWRRVQSDRPQTKRSRSAFHRVSPRGSRGRSCRRARPRALVPATCILGCPESGHVGFGVEDLQKPWPAFR